VPTLPGLRRIRDRKAFTQRELAAAAGVTHSTIALLEAGKTSARPSTIRKLAAALNVEPHELMEPAE
jgi:transcriptional regulator with XRE-family HTH domain